MTPASTQRFVAALLALAVPFASAGAVEVQRGDDALSLALRTTGSVTTTASFEGGADIKAEVGAIQTDLAASIQLGRSLSGVVLPSTGSQVSHGNRLSLTTGWTTDDLALTFNAAQRRQETTTAPVSLTPQLLQTQVLSQTDRSTGVTAQLRPLGDVTLSLAAQASSSAQLVGGTAATPSEQMSDNVGLVSGATWQPGPSLGITTQVAVARARVAWADEHAARYARSTVSPRLVATFGPAVDRQIRLTAEHVVSPPVLLPTSEDGARVQGEGEWRVMLDARRPLLTGVSLTTGVTIAARQGVTEFGAAANDGELPVTVGSGVRRQVDIGLTADLARIGLDGATLSGSGAMRYSPVDDPVTGETRRSSGEVPLQAKLAFAQALPLRAARWGIDGYVDGPTEFYGVRDMTRIATAAGMGAFVDYAPGPVRVQFRIDNLLGGDRDSRIDYYQGLRGSSDIDRTERRGINGRAVSIVFSGKV